MGRFQELKDESDKLTAEVDEALKLRETLIGEVREMLKSAKELGEEIGQKHERLRAILVEMSTIKQEGEAAIKQEGDQE